MKRPIIYAPYVPVCVVNGLDCCAHHMRRNTPVTPSQLSRINQLANRFYYAGEGSDEAFDSATARVLSIYDDIPPPDPDTRCQPEKAYPERYTATGELP